MKDVTNKRLVMVVNVDWFFLSHRLEIARAAQQAGWEVHVATTLTGDPSRLAVHGFKVHDIPMHRSSSNPLALLQNLVRYFVLFRSVRPQVVHLVTIKPVLLGGIATLLARVPGVVFAVSGLGHVFVTGHGLGGVRRVIVRGMYRLALGHRNKVVIFQNSLDEAELVSLGCVREEQIVRLPGSGFDVDEYKVSEIPSGTPVFMMASRLIRTKGVLEFIAAAIQLSEEGIDAEFWLIGAPDPLNPEGLTLDEVEQARRSTRVKILGHRDDVPDLMRSAAVIVLPSYYGEGLPKVLIEAAAAGRAVITTDAPGCRDAIENGVTGILVPERDVKALADAMRSLAVDRVAIEQFGRNGRKRAESIFRIQDVVARHLQIYEEVSRR